MSAWLAIFLLKFSYVVAIITISGPQEGCFSMIDNQTYFVCISMQYYVTITIILLANYC